MRAGVEDELIASGILIGPHMNKKGATWQIEKICERVAQSHADWSKHETTGTAEGYHWVVYLNDGGARRLCGIIGYYREPGGLLYKNISHFHPDTSDQIQAAALRLANTEFFDLEPEENMVWALVSGKNSVLVTQVGYECVVENATMARPRGGKSCRIVSVAVACRP